LGISGKVGFDHCSTPIAAYRVPEGNFDRQLFRRRLAVFKASLRQIDKLAVRRELPSEYL